MTRIIVPPQSLDLTSPGRRDYWVALEHDSIWGEYHIPLTVFVGPDAQDGMGLVAFGSNHGNEYEGPVAIKHLLREFDIGDVTGRIILVPVLNPAAFRSGTRDSRDADGVNLNRAFVDGAGKTSALSGITHRIAAFVRDTIWPQVHVVLDLHAGGEVARFAMCASYHPIDNEEQCKLIHETARWFGLPFIATYQDRTPGLLPSEAERLGKITVGTELGWGASVQPAGVRAGKHGVRAAAIHHGQLRGSIEPVAHHADGTQKCVSNVARECFIPAPFPGHYEPVVECGTAVNKGDLIGYLHDFNRIDEDPHPMTANMDGYVLAQAWDASVQKGQHIIVVAVETGEPF